MRVVALGLAGGAPACDAPPPAGPSGLAISIAAGDAQVAPAGARFGTPLTVEVRDAGGAAAKGVRVRFDLVPGSRGALADSVGVTSSDGRASVVAVAAAPGDTLRVDAMIAFAPRSRVRFTGVATNGPVVTTVFPTDVRAGDTISFNGSALDEGALTVTIAGVTARTIGFPTANSVRAIVPPCGDTGAVTASLTVGTAAAAPVPLRYRASRTTIALEPYGFTVVPASRVADCAELPGGGATYLIAAQFASAPAGSFAPESLRLAVEGLTASARQLPDRGFALQSLLTPSRRVQAEFDGFLRALESNVTARAASPADTTAPPAGSIRRFSVVSSTDGSSFTEVTASLEFVGDHILGYSDLEVPVPTAEQRALLQLMDRHLWSAAVSAFGADPDVDRNGRIIVLSTPAVNRLVRAQDCLLQGYVQGFFYPPDLDERAPHSNRGEVFYAFVPDAAGAYSCPHSQRDVVRELQPRFIHELQHLISFNEHVLARGGRPEDAWLNEALGRAAEELGSQYFESRYPPPFGRSSAAQLFPDSSAPFIGPLLLNAYVYLNSSLGHSATAYVGAGSLEDHGAGWLFLRWVTHQKGDAVLRRLVQTRLTGVANLEAATGERFGALFGDFSLALFADSLPGIPRASVPPRLRYSGLSLRRLMAREAAVQGFPVPFPLTTYLAQPGSALRAAMPPGTMMHAIVPSTSADARVRFSLTTPRMTPLPAALGAQVGILRLPP